MSERTSVPGDLTGDNPVAPANGDGKDMATLVVIFAIIFAYASRWWRV